MQIVLNNSINNSIISNVITRVLRGEGSKRERTKEMAEEEEIYSMPALKMATRQGMQSLESRGKGKLILPWSSHKECHPADTLIRLDQTQMFFRFLTSKTTRY